MIEGVELRDVLLRTDERGHLGELYSTNFGDQDLCHVYRCMVRPGVAKAFHCHVGIFDRYPSCCPECGSALDTMIPHSESVVGGCKDDKCGFGRVLDGIISPGSWDVGQTDRFTPIVGVTKVGLVDCRGPLGSREDERPIITLEKIGTGHIRAVSGASNYLLTDWVYYGINGTPTSFREAWPTDEAWIERVGESPTFLQQQTVILDASSPQVLFIPPGVAHGIYALDKQRAEILNAPTVPFNREAPDELRIPADSFGFEWEPKSR